MRSAVAWYDWFARFYDASLERLYADARDSAADALELGSARTVLDAPTGTGQSLSPLLARLPANGTVEGVDLSKGMIERAQRRVEQEGHGERVRLQVADVTTVASLGPVDRLHIFLGMSTFPDMDAAFANLWSLLRPGGRAVIVDTHAETLGFQGRMVNWIAQADIRRRFWEPLEQRAEAFERRELPPNPKYGGALWLATGVKPER